MSRKVHIERPLRPLVVAVGLLSAAGLGGCGGSQAGANHASTGTHTSTAVKSESESAPKQAAARGATRTSTTATQTRTATTTQTSSTSSAAAVRHLRSSALRSVFATYVSCLKAHGAKLPVSKKAGGPIVNAKHIDLESPAFKRASALCTPVAKAALRAAEERAGGR